MTVLCVVQARFGSSRLPGKVLRHIGEMTMLERVLTRLSRAVEVDDLVVATTQGESDDAVAEAAAAFGAGVVRGSQFDVLDRFYSAVLAYPTTSIVVRVTADCPFVDPAIVDTLVRALHASELDFVANRLPPPHKRTYPIGLDVEVCTVHALRRAWHESTLGHHREHVMPYIYEHQDRFNVQVMQLDRDLSQFRWTVDTPEDLEAARALAGHLDPEPFGWLDVLRVATEHPSIAAINENLVQKDVTEVDQRWDSS